MAEAPPAGALRGKVILIVEDEYILASDLAQFLHQNGADVAGPAGSVQQALALIDRHGPTLDAAVLDINLRNERIYPAADRLIAQGVPVVFATGYEELLLNRGYLGIPHVSKPVNKQALALLVEALAGKDAGRTKA